jgi:hypothetical protein
MANIVQLKADLQIAQHFLAAHADRHAESCARSYCPICEDSRNFIAELEAKLERHRPISINGEYVDGNGLVMSR